jgi:sporulation integral membrane protein YtvI
LQGGFSLSERRRLLTRLKPLLLFFAVFTALFCLFALTLKYTFPFLVGFLLALLAQPLIRWMRGQLHFPGAVASIIATLVVYAVLFGLLFLLGFWLISEISHLVSHISGLSAGAGALTGPLQQLLERLGSSLQDIDADFIRQNQEQLVSIAKNGIGIVSQMLTAVLRFLTSLPTILTMFLVMILSTYFFSKDMESIRRRFTGMFSGKTVGNLKSYSHKGADMSWRYVRSYLLIYFITFLETLAVFAVLGVPYPLVLSIVTGIADLLPVFGPGTIYVPLSVFYALKGDYFRAVTLLVCWLLISAIRQIIEPKIVSSSINIHPLTMLAALYFALVAKNFWVLIYFSALIICYQIFTQSGALPRLFGEEPAAAGSEKMDGDSGKREKNGTLGRAP